MVRKSGFSALRKAAVSGGVCIFALSGLFGNAQAREADDNFNPFRGRGDATSAQGDFRRMPPPNQFNRPRLAPGQTSIKAGNKPGIKANSKQAEKKAPPPPPGPHLLIVSIKSQRVTLYSNGKPAATSPVSSGTPQNPTPHGVFSIIQRNRHHRSNIYSGAPMPYMQRLTWSGIALHQGVLPGRPASHGCIRLPESFANFLWNTTKMNTRVIVARDDVEPREIVHAKLFQPKAVPTTVENPMQEMRKTFDTTHQFVRTAGMQMVITDAVLAAEEAKGESAPLVNAPSAEENAAKINADNAQPTLQSADEKPAIADVKPAEPEVSATENASAPQAAPVAPAQPELAGSAKPEPATENKAVEAKPDIKPEVQPEITSTVLPPQPADIPDAILASFEKSLAAKAKRVGPTGPVSVFISRKDKRLYVRQAFIPLFTADVKFKDENAAFGTHVFTAYDQDDGKSLRWTYVTMPAEAAAAAAEKAKPSYRIDAYGRRIEIPAKPAKVAEAPAGAVPSAASVLDRIDIPQEVVDRISYYMTPGSSLIVADQGLGQETGLYTDFIVVTKK